MKKNTITLIIITLSLLSIRPIANAQDGYIETDTATLKELVEFKFIDVKEKTNYYRFFKAIITGKAEAQVIYPRQVKSFKLYTGEIFISQEINIKGESTRVFLKQVLTGTKNLYHYTNKYASVEDGEKPEAFEYYFLSSPSGLVELNKDNYREVLRGEIADSPGLVDQLDLVKFNRKAIAQIIGRYNKGSNKVIQYRKLGVSAGYISTDFITTSNSLRGQSQSGQVASESNDINIGFYASFPLYKNNLSLVSGAIFSIFNLDQGGRNDVTLSLPLLLRYTYPSNKVRPFINTGVSVNFNLNRVTDFGTINNQGEIQPTTSFALAGLTGGGGIEFALIGRQTFTIEMRYTVLAGSEPTLNERQLGILGSLTF